MRLINILIFLAVIFGAFWLYIYLEEFAKWIGAVEFRGRFESISELILKTVIPQVLIVYTVLAVGGAMLAYFLNSSVPLKWCLALGLICAVGNMLALSFASIEWVIVNTLISAGMLVMPVFGGYQIKRRAWRINRRPPN